MTWKTNEVKVFLDGVQEGNTDTLCDIPDDLDRINIGGAWVSPAELNGLLNNIKIYKVITTK
jgi:hypothetical protein